jgi:hypothetical protein
MTVAVSTSILALVHHHARDRGVCVDQHRTVRHLDSKISPTLDLSFTVARNHRAFGEVFAAVVERMLWAARAGSVLDPGVNTAVA